MSCPLQSFSFLPSAGFKMTSQTCNLQKKHQKSEANR
uniref:Uncharacterized protein n=1 Tax=Arundo donax TaxID=35708 RepID=A0A0A9FAX1_ARUDO